jgi:hypothetical protein
LERGVSTFSPHPYGCNVKYKSKPILNFNSLEDFSAFWSFWVGIYFHEFEKVNENLTIEKPHGGRFFFKDELKETFDNRIKEIDNKWGEIKQVDKEWIRILL